MGFLLRFKPFENKSSNENQSNIETKNESLLFEDSKNISREDKLINILSKIDKSIDKLLDKNEADEFQADKLLKLEATL